MLHAEKGGNAYYVIVPGGIFTVAFVDFMANHLLQILPPHKVVYLRQVHVKHSGTVRLHCYFEGFLKLEL